MRWVLQQPFSSPRCWLVQSVRRQRPVAAGKGAGSLSAAISFFFCTWQTPSLTLLPHPLPSSPSLPSLLPPFPHPHPPTPTSSPALLAPEASTFGVHLADAAGQAEFCSKSYTFRVTFPKVNHPAKNMEKEKRKVKLKKTQELKNETTLVTPKNFTFASSSLTLSCFVQGVQFNFEGERQHHSKEAPTPKTRRRENNTPTREREEANNTQKEEENSTTQEGKQQKTAPPPRTGEAGKQTPPTKEDHITFIYFTVLHPN